MKKDEVGLGLHYEAKVSGKLAVVRIDRALPQGGWSATSLKTGRSITIRGARRLRREVHEETCHGWPKGER